MVDRYAKLATEHLAAAGSRIETSWAAENVVSLLRFRYGETDKKEPAIG